VTLSVVSFVPACKLTQDPPSYAVPASVLITYVPMVNCNVGHAVPGTNDPITYEVSCAITIG
jgi:hypothetical protein